MEPSYELTFSHEGRAAIHFPLSSHRVVLGTAADCDLTLTGRDIASQHAVLALQHGIWQIEPLSDALMAVNGRALTAPMPLAPGALLSIGDWTIQFQQTSTIRTDTAQGVTKLLAPEPKAHGAGPFILRFTDTDGLPREFKLKAEHTTIGKGAVCDLVLEDDYISARHMEIRLTPEGATLRDLGSTNGTFVGGIRIQEITLEDGAEITCGKTKIVFLNTLTLTSKRDLRLPWTAPLLGRSPAFAHLAKQIERVAPLAQNVFIHGETGTGKELVAAALHELSSRKERPFVALNCGAISKELMESELFGHEKGAFTGAQQRRVGAFELAHGGTLFLDEIGELPPELQPKLLRVLETGCFRRVGGRDELKVDVRVFSATHRDLAESIRLGRFREDLYYRLYILPVEVPSLRERLEDIRLLVQFFIAQACPEEKLVSVSPDVFPFLKSHRWPGNVRELRNLVYRALAFCDGPVLKKEHISPFLRPSPTHTSAGSEAHVSLDLSPIKRKEREVIIDVLRDCRGNQSEAAKRLSIGRTTLYYKIKEYAIDMRRIGLVG